MRRETFHAARRLLIGLWVGLVFLGLSCKDRANRSQVVLYCSVDQEVAEPIIAEFERQSGIRVLAKYDTEASKTVGLAQRLRAEASAPAADVFWSGEIFHTIRLAREGLLAPYRGEGVSPLRVAGILPAIRGQDARATFADPNRCWYGFALRGRVIGYNTNRVPAAEAPKSLEDVLAPQWKGRLVMASPAFGTTGGDVASWFAHYGPDRARQILRGLKDNEVRLVSGNSTAVRMVATGQADICFTDTDDIYAGQRNGWPVAMNFLDQGDDGALAIPNTAALVKGGPNPQNASVLMRFLLSEELERRLVESDSHNSPLHAEVAAEYPQYALGHPLRVDYGRVADFLPAAIQAAREILE
ncbi:MAG: extracellular solute-binding protein [Planctomycetes bacterium]|nr:extracellular solute-binding protein [Planctomycetota bacterium]